MRHVKAVLQLRLVSLYFRPKKETPKLFTTDSLVDR